MDLPLVQVCGRRRAQHLVTLSTFMPQWRHLYRESGHSQKESCPPAAAGPLIEQALIVMLLRDDFTGARWPSAATFSAWKFQRTERELPLRKLLKKSFNAP